MYNFFPTSFVWLKANFKDGAGGVEGKWKKKKWRRSLIVTITFAVIKDSESQKLKPIENTINLNQGKLSLIIIREFRFDQFFPPFPVIT